ncbi:MAG: hypothetical protein R3178_07450, partial [Rhodothermales bacterium]|nr:hypothetical protein [Rhodothermales bacterium]
MAVIDMASDASSRERRVRKLFDVCVDLPVAERKRILQDVEPAIRESVEALLAADEENSERLRRLDQPVLSEESAVGQGQRVGRYEILRELGRGGMGVVHLARDTELDRTLVLKFLSPAIASDEEARERFVREARAASALD